MKSFTVTTTKTFTPRWVRFPFMTYDKVYRAARDKFGYKAGNCFKCLRKFNDGEVFGLGCLEGVGNKTFCESCINEIK